MQENAERGKLGTGKFVSSLVSELVINQKAHKEREAYQTSNRNMRPKAHYISTTLELFVYSSGRHCEDYGEYPTAPL